MSRRKKEPETPGQRAARIARQQAERLEPGTTLNKPMSAGKTAVRAGKQGRQQVTKTGAPVTPKARKAQKAATISVPGKEGLGTPRAVGLDGSYAGDELAVFHQGRRAALEMAQLQGIPYSIALMRVGHLPQSHDPAKARRLPAGARTDIGSLGKFMVAAQAGDLDTLTTHPYLLDVQPNEAAQARVWNHNFGNLGRH